MIDISPELITVLMFVGLLIGLFMGHPLVLLFWCLAVIFGWLGWGPSVFYIFMNRILGDDGQLCPSRHSHCLYFMAQLLGQVRCC